MSDPSESVYERAATAIIEYSQGQFIANEVHDIADILREHFPAPSARQDAFYAPDLTRHWLQQNRPELVPHAEFINGQMQRAFDKGKQIGEGNIPAPSAATQPTEKPDAVGWYECRHRQDSAAMRVVRWWNGESLHFSTHGKTTGLFHYTDFIGPLVPGAEPNK